MEVPEYYNIVLLKLTGESLGSPKKPLNIKRSLAFITREIRNLLHEFPKLKLAIVIGGGNFIRGKELKPLFHDSTTPDRMGMLCTVVNALAIQDQLERMEISTRVQSSIVMPQICEQYIKRRAEHHMEEGRVVILAGGTGNPNFTTDTAAVEKALDIGAEIVLKATKVDGIYDKDPNQHANARLIEKTSYDEVMKKNLRIMDSAAIGLAREHQMPILVFNFFKKGNLIRAVTKQQIGSFIY
ncbi:MAG: UMP kinase [Candidatus Niyogibacteria bacterium]|nr:UMP kinase [Candidatus Niyogibacteria bacterium]